MSTHYQIIEISGLRDRVNGYTRNKVNGLHLHHLSREGTKQEKENDEKIIYTKINPVKTKSLIIKGLILFLLILAGAGKSWAQGPYPSTGDQTVCITGVPEPYGVIFTAGSTYAWSVDGTVSSPNWTLHSNGANLTSITWMNPGVYRLRVVETITATNCIGQEVFIMVTVNPAPSAPVGTDITACEESPIQTLTATATAPAGSTVVWYNAATGGTVVASPTLNRIGTITYYAESQTASGCASLSRTAVTLTINPAPLPPTASNITECETSPIQTLTAVATAPAGATVTWYNAPTGGTVVASPTLSSVGTVTYYAESVMTAGGCTSLTRTAVTLTISPAPLPPTASNINECEASPVQTLTAIATAPAGATVTWYNAPTGGTVVTSPTLNTVGTVTYYAESVVTAGGCTSLTRTAVTLTISPAPLPPTATNITECEASPVQTLTAVATAPAGANVTWYNAATGGTVVTTPTLSAVGTITYYAESVVTAGICTSLTRTPVTLTINPAPAAPTGSSVTECETTPIQTLTAVATAPAGATVVWYNAATGGTVVASPTLNSVGSVTYYAESLMTTGGCRSLTRTAVTLTITQAPLPPTASNVTECEILPIQTLTAVATSPAGTTVVWYNAATGGSVVASPTLNTVGSVTYYAETVVTAGGCTSLTRTPVTLTINPAPAAPTASNITECEASPIQTLTALATAPAGATVTWYNAASGGTVVASPTLNTVGTVTYYAQSVNTTGGCMSLTRTAVTLTITPAPAAPVASNVTVCEATPVQTITATASAPAGASVVWYDAATGGNVVASPTLNTVGTVTYYAESVADGGCRSLTRTAVTLTIRPVPTPMITGSNPVCESVNGATEIYRTAASGNTFSWTVVGGTFSGQGTNQISVTWTTPGSGSVSVTETIDSTGCSATVTNNITVNPAPQTGPIYHN